MIEGLKKVKAYSNKFFILFYIVPIAFLYIISMSNSFNYALFLRFDRRIGIIIWCLIFGIGYFFYHSKGFIIRSKLIFSSLLLSLYMLVVGVLSLDSITSFISFFSCVFVWFLMLLISNNVLITDDQDNTISTIIGSTGGILAFLYLNGLHQGLITVASINSIYYILCCFPFVFRIRSPFLRIFLLVIIMITVLLSGKTTCIILCSISCVFFYSKKIFMSFRRSIAIIISISVLSFVINANIVITDLDVTELFDSISSDLTNGSGRYNIYQEVYSNFCASDINHLVFGHGYNGVSKSIGIGAHNDFLQVLFDYGLVGFLIYIYFWITLIYNLLLMYQVSDRWILYAISIIIFLGVSSVSNFINTQVPMILFSIYWGLFSPKKNIYV